MQQNTDLLAWQIRVTVWLDTNFSHIFHCLVLFHGSQLKQRKQNQIISFEQQYNVTSFFFFTCLFFTSTCQPVRTETLRNTIVRSRSTAQRKGWRTVRIVQHMSASGCLWSRVPCDVEIFNSMLKARFEQQNNVMYALNLCYFIFPDFCQ